MVLVSLLALPLLQRGRNIDLQKLDGNLVTHTLWSLIIYAKDQSLEQYSCRPWVKILMLCCTLVVA